MALGIKCWHCISEDCHLDPGENYKAVEKQCLTGQYCQVGGRGVSVGFLNSLASQIFLHFNQICRTHSETVKFDGLQHSSVA